MLPYLRDINSEASGISYHSPLTLYFSFGTKLGNTLWKVNPYWLSLVPSSEEIMMELFIYQNINRTSASPLIYWDAIYLLHKSQELGNKIGNGKKL